MKFGPLPLEEADGAILAHSHKGTGHKGAGRRLPKGTRLDAATLAQLRAEGVTSVIAARLEPGDLHEDAAARRFAAVLCGAGLTAAEPFTGRVNLVAEGAGLLVVDRARVEALNALHEGLTVATLEPWAVVEPKRMVATIKVIPFALPEAVIRRAEDLAAAGGPPPIRLAPFQPRRLGLIQTRLPGMADKMLDKTRQVTAGRLSALGSTLADERRCAHEPEALAAALRAQLAEAAPDILAVAGASAIVDRGDVIPAAIEDAGGEVLHYGMPVDPGNLILLGRLAGLPVLGLPGCARSPALNGLDWVLERLCAGLPLTGAAIMGMGVGGLLKETAARPQPRGATAEDAAGAQTGRAPRVVAVLLAAGRSTRMGGRNKLLLDWRGKPLVAHAADALLDTGLDRVIAVLGHQAEAVKAALGDRSLHLVENPNPARGLSTSLRRGLAALPDGTDGVLVALGDMPGITAGMVRRLIAAFDPVEGRVICVPTLGGRRGNPVLFARRFVPEMMDVDGDVGARPVLAAHAHEITEVPMDDMDCAEAVHWDVDTPEAARGLEG